MTFPGRHAVSLRTNLRHVRRAVATTAGLTLAVTLLAPFSAGSAAPAAAPAPAAVAAPARSVPGPAPAGADATFDAGGQVTCRVLSSGSMYCAGDNEFGQLGVGDTRDRTRFTRVDSPVRWRSVSTSGGATCGISTTHDLYCWGMNSSGQLGIGDAGQQWRPKRVAGSGVWRQVSVGWTSTCAIRTDNALFCWGGNGSGQLGLGHRTGTRVPKRVGTSRSWSTVTMGGFHACGTLADGTGWCWGRGDLGQLGSGATSTLVKPTRVRTSMRFRAMDAGWSTTCALTRSRALACWGLGDQGQLGIGAVSGPMRYVRAPRAVQVGGRRFASVTLGDGHACGRDLDGGTWCWGANRYGQLGIGGGAGTTTPVAVPGGARYDAVRVGWMHTCGVVDGGAVQCWGNNEDGQLVAGDRVGRNAPPGVNARRAAPRLRGPDGRLVVTSFNILGSQHTRPGGGVPHFAPGRIRTEWAANMLRGSNADIVAFQELQHDQFEQLRTSLGNTYSFYPENTTRSPKVVWQAMMWRTSEWELVDSKDVWVPVIGKTRPNPFLKLRNRATGRSIWIMNVHNSSKRTPQRQRERNEAVRIEINHVKQQRRAGYQAILLGDFNERETTFCKVTGQTDLEAINGGSHDGRRCNPPRGMHIDWIFGSRAFTRRGHAYTRTPLTHRITDHTVLTGRYRYPGA